MQGSLRTKQLACLFRPFFVSGLRSEHCNLPRYALAESGPNMANRHTIHSACSVTQRSQCKGSPEHALGHVVEVGCMWWLLPSHSPFSALCCTQSLNTVELDSDYSWAGGAFKSSLASPHLPGSSPGPARTRAVFTPNNPLPSQPIHRLYLSVPDKESSSQFTYRVSTSHFLNSITVGKVPGVPEPCLQSFLESCCLKTWHPHTLKPLRNGPPSVLLALLSCCRLHGGWLSRSSLVQRYEHNPLQLPLPSRQPATKMLMEKVMRL